MAIAIGASALVFNKNHQFLFSGGKSWREAQKTKGRSFANPLTLFYLAPDFGEKIRTGKAIIFLTY